MVRSWRLLLSVLSLFVSVGAAGAVELRGTVQGVTTEGRVIAVQREGEEPVLIQYDDKTAFRDVKGAEDLREGETVQVDYRELADRSLATAITLVLPPLPKGVAVRSRTEIEGLISSGNKGKPFLLVDLRTPEEYAVAHLPGAISAPYAFLEKRRAEQLPEDKGVPVIFYANLATTDAFTKVVLLAQKYQHRDISIYRGGMADWLGSGNPAESSAEYLKSGTAIIIDLRSEAAVVSGHIPEAVNIPLARFERSLLPVDKRVPLIFYGDGADDAAAVVRKVSGWGYRKVTAFSGGVAAWVENGDTLVRGSALGDIRQVTSPVTGTIGMGDLENSIVSTGVVTMLDVRSAKEFAAGKLSNAVNIPLESLGKRLGELDKKRILVVYSSDANRARVAYQFLVGKGFRVVYLDTPLEIRKDGTYRVKE